MKKLISVIALVILIASLNTAVLTPPPAGAANVAAMTGMSPTTVTVGTPVAVGGLGGAGGWFPGEAITV